MCGRYVSPDEASIEREFNLVGAEWRFPASFNVAPTQNVPVIRADDDEVQGSCIRWGLIPFFAKGETPKYSTINARVETIETAASYRGPFDNFTLHIYASMAEQERKMISERYKAAATIAKAQGRKFGLQLRAKSWQRRFSAMGRAALKQEALERARAYRVHLEWALRQPGVKGRPISFRAAAIELNKRYIETPFGGQWRGHYLQRMTRRLEIDHPLTRMPEDLARARMRSLWEQRPNITCGEAVASMGTAHPLDIRRAQAFLQEYRRDAATRSRLHVRVGWLIDHKTVTRILIGELWKRHPV